MDLLSLIIHAFVYLLLASYTAVFSLTPFLPHSVSVQISVCIVGALLVMQSEHDVHTGLY